MAEEQGFIGQAIRDWSLIYAFVKNIGQLGIRKGALLARLDRGSNELLDA